MSTAHETLNTSTGTVKLWTEGVPVEDSARQQLLNVAELPVVKLPVAAMPDVHLGYGATVGSVIPTSGAIIPAAVGVDIGCGMIASQTSLFAKDLPDNLKAARTAIERAVPHGRTSGQRGRDRGSWGSVPEAHGKVWKNELADTFKAICDKHPKVEKSNHIHHLGSLGTGNHFVELCVDESQRVWVMLHSGSRGVGNRIGSYFIELAKADMHDQLGNLPHRDLAYFNEGAQHFEDYVQAVGWAQNFARLNRELMMANTIASLQGVLGPFEAHLTAVNCHHNYVAEEVHFGERVFVTRKGAVRAGKGEMGIIPGSMGAKSFIVRGKGDPESYCSCSHGAGRKMSRTAARKRYTVDDHVRATAGVECRKDAGVIDETPMAYKDIDAVMNAQRELVDIVHTLRQVVCVKG